MVDVVITGDDWIAVGVLVVIFVAVLAFDLWVRRG